jgi:hypothetical protein
MSDGFGSLISVAPVLMPRCMPTSYCGLPIQLRDYERGCSKERRGELASLLRFVRSVASFAKQKASQTDTDHRHWQMAESRCGGCSKAKPNYSKDYDHQYEEASKNLLNQPCVVHRTPFMKASTLRVTRQSPLGHSLSIPHCISTIFWNGPSRQDLNTSPWT